MDYQILKIKRLKILDIPCPFNNNFLRERCMASTTKMEYQVFLCIFLKKSAMATLSLKEIGKLHQTYGSHRKVHWENAKKVWYYEKWIGHHASFPPRRSVKFFFLTWRHHNKIQCLNQNLRLQMLLLQMKNHLQRDWKVSAFKRESSCFWLMFFENFMYLNLIPTTWLKQLEYICK